MVRRALSEIKHDGARSPAKVFAHRMKQYAAEMLAAPRQYDLQSALAELSRGKSVRPQPE